MARSEDAHTIRLNLGANDAPVDSPRLESFAGSTRKAKILVRRSEFDRWLENHRLEPMDVGCIVNEMVADLIDTN